MTKKIISIVIALSLTLLVSGCSWFGGGEEPLENKPETTATDANTGLATNNLTNIDPSSIDATITKNYADAKSKAAAWKSDAIITTFSVKFPGDLSTKKANETYVFGSATEPNYWFSYSVSEATDEFIRAIIPKDDYLGTNVKPINTTYWKMNYIKAYQLAEASGGSNFRSQNKNYSINATLHHTQPNGWLWWEISYQATATNNKLILKINPNDNNIVDENGNPVSTGEKTSGNVSTQ